MRPPLKTVLPTLLASITLAACGSSGYGSGSSSSSAPAASSSSATNTSAAVVKTASSSTLGATVLTDAQGMTLYSLSGESAGKLICASATCTQIWHPLAGSAASGVGSLGTFKRPDGTEQVTYKGMPLYTFAQDQQPGEVKGQNLKDVGTWSAVTVGAAAAAPKSTESTSSTPPRSHGYGY
jgi:predicted lipoprotein with Yx(FWY)xxD motif